MNCKTCKNPEHCLVKGIGNCVKRNDTIDFYYNTTEDGKCVFKKCHENCKSCSGEGNDINNKCLSCKDNFQFNPEQSGNCVEICKYYWYLEQGTN